MSLHGHCGHVRCLENRSEQKEAKITEMRAMEEEKATACGTDSREELFTSWPLA